MKLNSYVGIWIGWSESQPPPEMYKYVHWHWNNNQSGVIPNTCKSLNSYLAACMQWFCPRTTLKW